MMYLIVWTDAFGEEQIYVGKRLNPITNEIELVKHDEDEYNHPLYFTTAESAWKMIDIISREWIDIVFSVRRKGGNGCNFSKLT